MKRSIGMAAPVALAATLLFSSLLPAATREKEPKPLAEQVRHELVMMPFLTIYDNLSFRVDGDVVTLMGQTIRPTIRTDAQNIVARLAGVRTVNNQIEVLPLSPFDDRLRIGVARSIYGYTALNRYALGALPSIRVIVKNGNVTLEGVVANQTDRDLAFIRANGVPGVFSVTNNLRVETKRLA